MHPPRRSARAGFVAPGHYRVEASLSQPVLAPWQRVSCRDSTVEVKAGEEIIVEVVVEPARGIEVSLELGSISPGHEPDPATFVPQGPLRAQRRSGSLATP
ncbi:MAG: hypothetical protein AAGG01_23560 [Planctomycetota bacterium]